MKTYCLLLLLNVGLLLTAGATGHPTRWYRTGLFLLSEPQPLTWDQLRDVQFKKKWSLSEGTFVLYPKFGPTVQPLNGKTVAIMGYVIPVDLESGLYVVSRYPVAACFFCGGAGPESIMMLKFKTPPRRFKTDERLTFSGTLKLNAENIYELNYILEGAEIRPTNP